MTAGRRAGSALVVTMLILVILTAAGLYAVAISTSGIEAVSAAEAEQAAIDAAEAGLYYGIDRFPGATAERGLRLPNGSGYDVSVFHSGTEPMPGYDMDWAQARFLVRSVGRSPRGKGRRPTAEAEGVLGPVASGTEPAGRIPESGADGVIPVGPPSPYYLDVRDPAARRAFVLRHGRRNRVLIAAAGGGNLRILDGGSSGPGATAPGADAPPYSDRIRASVADIRTGVSSGGDGEEADTGWRTVAVAGVAGEEGGLFAFDVTDVRSGASAKMLWKIPASRLPMLGSSRSKPSIGKVRVPAGRLDDPGATTDRWVLLVGASRGILVLEAESGRVLQLLSHPRMGEIPAPPAVAFDRQGYIDRAYAGDLHGNLWRAVVDDSGRFDLGKGPFFSIAGGRIGRRIQEACAVVPAEEGIAGLWILFGTGGPGTRPDGPAGGIFAVVDASGTGSGSAGEDDGITEADLTDATSFFHRMDDPKSRFPSLGEKRSRGWYAMLPRTGEQIRFAPRVFFFNLYLATSVPSPKEAGVPGTGHIYGFGIIPGKNLGEPALLGPTGSGEDRTIGSEPPWRVRRVRAGGISSSPVLSIEGPGRAILSIRSDDGDTIGYRVPAPRRRKSIRYWRIFRAGGGPGD